MTLLAERLREQIRRAGPISFCDWMRIALYDERHGYYNSREERWGRAGDYRTSPERSILFASTFARYFAALYDQLGSPEVFHIIESGGGAGDFACGVMQTFKRDYPALFSSTHYIFEEVSANTRARAAAVFAPFGEKVEICGQLDGNRSFESAIFFSNELLDAFPVHRLVKRGESMREIFVDVDESGTFGFVERDIVDPKLSEQTESPSVADGQTIEVSLEAISWIRRAALMLRRGFVVVVDYGDFQADLYASPHRHDGTVRAFRRHELVDDFLQRPGEVDLTTTINWSQIIAEADRSGLRKVTHERQDAFLMRSGILDQLELETQFISQEADIARMRLDAREMILPGGMAENFQVLVLAKGVAP